MGMLDCGVLELLYLKLVMRANVYHKFYYLIQPPSMITNQVETRLVPERICHKPSRAEQTLEDGSKSVIIRSQTETIAFQHGQKSLYNPTQVTHNTIDIQIST